MDEDTRNRVRRLAQACREEANSGRAEPYGIGSFWAHDSRGYICPNCAMGNVLRRAGEPNAAIISTVVISTHQKFHAFTHVYDANDKSNGNPEVVRPFLLSLADNLDELLEAQSQGAVGR